MQSATQEKAWKYISIAGDVSEEQGRHLWQVLESALKEAMPGIVEQLDRYSVRDLLHKKEELAQVLARGLWPLLREKALPTELHQNEEVASQREYLRDYRPKPLPGQVTRLRELFPELKDSVCQERLARFDPPDGAEAWFAFPSWEALGGSYHEAVERVLQLLASKRRFENRVQGKLGLNYLRQTDRSEQAWKLLARQQPECKILVLPVQAGMRHRGRSPRRARLMMAPHEFGLGVFATAILILLHPERLGNQETLMLDCCGDDYSLSGDGHFERVPLFDVEIGGLNLSIFYRNRARALWGSATGFLVETPALASL